MKRNKKLLYKLSNILKSKIFLISYKGLDYKLLSQEYFKSLNKNKKDTRILNNSERFIKILFDTIHSNSQSTRSSSLKEFEIYSGDMKDDYSSYNHVIEFLEKKRIIFINHYYLQLLVHGESKPKKYLMEYPYVKSPIKLSLKEMEIYPEPEFLMINPKKKRNILPEPIDHIILNNIQSLEIDWDKIHQLKEISFSNSIRLVRFLYRIKQKIINYKSDKHGRRYNVFVQGKKEFKGFVQYNGENLVELDFPSCFPMLLLGFNIERDILIPILKKDIYNTILQETKSHYSREDCKVHFMRFIFNKRKGLRTEPYLQNWMLKTFPQLSQKIIDGGKSLHPQFFKWETELVFNQIGNELMERNRFFITVHDCIYTVPSQQEEIRDIMIEETEKKLGYIPKIVPKPVPTL